MGVRTNIDLSAEHQATVVGLLEEHLPEAVVWAYGSRVTWTARENSDLDLVVFARPRHSDQVGALRKAFEASDLPFQVNLLIWEELPESFKREIENAHVSLADKRCAAAERRWSEVTIGEIAHVVGGGTPSTKDPANFGGEIPWLTPRDLSGPHDRYVACGSRSLSQKGLDRSAATLLPRNTVLLSTRAPIGYVALAKNPIATNQGFRSLVVRPEWSPQYLYYWLLENAEELKRNASGSTFRELPGSVLKSLRLCVPDLPDQIAIAGVLGALDDRIELTRRTNATLEAMARALFKSWFVDFDPVRAKMERRDTGLPPDIAAMFPDRLVESESGEVPAGWTIGALRHLAVLNPEGWNSTEPPETVRYVDLKNTKWGVIGDVACYPWLEAPSRARRVLRNGDTIVGTVRPGNGSFALLDEDGLTGSTGFAVLRPRSPRDRELVWCAATSSENVSRLALLADGGAYPAIGGSVVAATPVALADAPVRREFSAAAGPLLDEMGANRRTSRRLAELRNVLLPALVSGDVRLPAALVERYAEVATPTVAGGREPAYDWRRSAPAAVNVRTSAPTADQPRTVQVGEP